MRLLIALSLLAVTAVVAEKARFDNYQLHRLTPETQIQVQALASLQLTNEYVYLTFPTRVNRGVDIVVPPHKRPEFEEFVSKYKFDDVLRLHNYQSVLDGEEKIVNARPKEMEWTTYHNLTEIYTWLDSLAKKYPMVKTIVAGKTYEGRQIRGIEITFGKNFTGIFIESGIHAAEWIAPAGTSWMINEILNSPKDSPFRRFNYIYVPVFNPDGYVYSWEKYRLWRKTRTPYASGAKVCFGADPNRNWDFHWGGNGTAQDPCASNYPGPRPFSEIEMKSVSEYITSIAKPKRLDMYFAFHSYYQLLMYPWGWTSQPTPLQKTWQRIGEAAVADLAAVHKKKFIVGNSYTTLWPTSGSSMDWVYNKFNLTISYLWEMRDTGVWAFVLPSRYIIPVGEEHFAGMKRILIEYEKLNVTKFSDAGHAHEELTERE